MQEIKVYNADPGAIGVFGLAVITLVAALLPPLHTLMQTEIP